MLIQEHLVVPMPGDASAQQEQHVHFRTLVNIDDRSKSCRCELRMSINLSFPSSGAEEILIVEHAPE